MIGGHIKVHRVGVQHIPIGCGHLHQRIVRAVFQSFRGDEIALVVGIEGIDHGHFRIGEGLGDERTIRAVELEGCSSIRNYISGFRIHLDDLDKALEIGVVDEIAVDFTVFGDKHIKVRHQFPALPAGHLMHRVHAVGHFFGMGKAVFVTGQIVTLRFFGIVIAASGFQVDRKLGPFLRRFDLGIAVVRVLDDGDAAHLHSFHHIQSSAVQLYGIVFCFRSYMVGGAVQQVALGRGNFPDAPVIAADIIPGSKLAVTVCGVGVHKLVALVNTVNGT